MRVLWFTQVELPAVQRRFSSSALHRCGWIDSLRAALCADGHLQLGMAAVGVTPFEPFTEEGVCYFRVKGPVRPGGVAGAGLRWLRRTDEGSLLAGASEIIDRFQPDLIHVHGTEGPFGLLATTTSVPILVSLQGILLVCSRAYFSGIPTADVLRDIGSAEFAKGRGLVHDSWNMRVAARRELRILRACRAFAGRTDWDRRIAHVVNPDAHYYHAEEVLRPEFYVQAWRPGSERRFVVYTTGGPAPYKGLVNLLEAVALLRGSLMPDIRLRVAGRIKDSSMWPVLQRAVDRWRLRGSVEWLGSLGPEDIVLELKGASVYVHPSIVENSPNSLAEAMLLGVPCVASAAGGVPSLMRDGHEGLLCPPNDVHGLAGAIGAIASDPAMASRLGANARQRARRRNDACAAVQTTLAIYEDVVSRQRGCG